MKDKQFEDFVKRLKKQSSLQELFPSDEITEEDVAIINGYVPGLRTPQERRI